MLTATVNGGEDQLLEVDLMKVFKIRTYDHSKGQYEPDEIKWNPIKITPDQYNNYFIERRKTQAILIYTSPTQKRLL